MRTASLIDELQAALTSGTDERRIEMLARISSLFVAGAARYSEEQISVFDDVMVRLVSTVEAESRAKLAHSLAPIVNAPPSVVHILAFDEDIDVARPILVQSERLDENALVANACSKSQQHLLAITQRQLLSEAVTDVLIGRGDREVVHSVVKNTGARFSDAGFLMLVTRSGGDEALAVAVGMRADIPRPHLLMLLEKVSSAVATRLLTAENSQASGAIGAAAVMFETAGGIRNEARDASSSDFAAKPTATELQNRALLLFEQALAS